MSNKEIFDSTERSTGGKSNGLLALIDVLAIIIWFIIFFGIPILVVLTGW